MSTETYESSHKSIGYLPALLMFTQHQDARRTLEEGRPYLRSGVPFSLYYFEGGQQEGRVVAAVAGEMEDLADLEKYPDGPLIRMHSACSFSEVGDNPQLDAWETEEVPVDDLIAIARATTTPSLECDCRAQREASQYVIAQQGGIFFDLIDHEGRGAGKKAKREGYRLHREEGLDTAEAYERQHLPFDTREYGHIARFLIANNIKRVQVLTNNPRKMAPLEAMGIQVTRVPLVVGVTRDNIGYLETKRDKAGHLFPESLR